MAQKKSFFGRLMARIKLILVLLVLGGGATWFFWDKIPEGIRERLVSLKDSAEDLLKRESVLAAKLAEMKKLEEPSSFAPKPKGAPQVLDDGDYTVTTQKYEAAAKFDKLIVLDPTTDVIYPGSLLKGETIETGQYTPLVYDRKPMKISISLENLDGQVSRTIDNPTLSSVRQSIRDILAARVTGATPAQISFEVQEIHSEEQLKLAIGANYSYNSGVVDVKAGFNFNRGEVRSRTMIKFIQKYYTIDMDLPGQPSDLFKSAKDVDLATLGSISPVYVSTVTYGRLALFTIESTSSFQEIQASLDAAFDVGMHAGGAQLSAEHKKRLDESTIKGTILGGSASDAVKSVFGLPGLQDYIVKGGNYSKDSPGAPMSYKLRYLADNSVSNVVMSSEYTVRNSVRKASKIRRYKVTLDRLLCVSDEDAGDYAEIYGVISASATDSRGKRVPTQGTAHLWNHPTDSHYQDIKQNSAGALSIGSQVIFTFDNPDTTQSKITISGWMKEDDSGGDESYGSASRTIFLKDFGANTTLTLNFNGGGGHVQAYFTLEEN